MQIGCQFNERVNQPPLIINPTYLSFSQQQQQDFVVTSGGGWRMEGWEDGG